MMVQQKQIANNNLLRLIDSLIKHIDTTSEVTADIVAEVKEKNDVAINKNMELLNEALEIFVQAVVALHSKYKAFEEYTPKEMNILKSAEIHLLSILKGVKMASEKSDEVMLIDLLEYELRDNLTQWKIRVLPKLKSLIV